MRLIESVVLETDDPAERDAGAGTDDSNQDEVDMYRAEMVGKVFANTDLDWDAAPDSGAAVDRKVGRNALKDLGNFIKNNRDWKDWYDSSFSKCSMPNFSSARRSHRSSFSN